MSTEKDEHIEVTEDADGSAVAELPEGVEAPEGQEGASEAAGDDGGGRGQARGLRRCPRCA